ncbi:MAG: hypothetical protein NVSMB25_25170 [Thermoleophilaceae bacterium]
MGFDVRGHDILSYGEFVELTKNLRPDAEVPVLTAWFAGERLSPAYPVPRLGQSFRSCTERPRARSDRRRRPANRAPSLTTALSPPPPTPPGDSYWVLDGQLLAGPYPGASKKVEAAAKLEAFLDAGVTSFVDLTEEGEGPPLQPYSALLRQLARERKTRVTHLRLPIRDVDIPASWQMRAILNAIRLALGEDETVYVHCWGGVGRTGTVVGCMLVENGIPPGDVLDELAR